MATWLEDLPMVIGEVNLCSLGDRDWMMIVWL